MARSGPPLGAICFAPLLVLLLPVEAAPPGVVVTPPDAGSKTGETVEPPAGKTAAAAAAAAAAEACIASGLQASPDCCCSLLSSSPVRPRFLRLVAEGLAVVLLLFVDAAVAAWGGCKNIGGAVPGASLGKPWGKALAAAAAKAAALNTPGKPPNMEAIATAACGGGGGAPLGGAIDPGISGTAVFGGVVGGVTFTSFPPSGVMVVVVVVGVVGAGIASSSLTFRRSACGAGAVVAEANMWLAIYFTGTVPGDPAPLGCLPFHVDDAFFYLRDQREFFSLDRRFSGS